MTQPLIDHQLLTHQRAEQHGVVTHRQLVEGGWPKEQIRAAVRRRELVRVHPGVYVDHTGPLTPGQRAWAAVLWAQPAALCGPSLLGVGPEDAAVHVAIDSTRRLHPPPGIRVRRLVGMEAMIRFGTSPPRLSLEHDLLVGIPGTATPAQVVGLLTSTVGRRGTSPDAVRRALDAHPKVPHRSLIARILDDMEHGTESVLEHGFLTLVERPHRLPTPTRQAARLGGRERRDLDYETYGVVVELDGRLNHESWEAGNRDARRDLADVIDGNVVLRLRWAQVMEQSCATAAALGTVLQRHGWTGAPARCPACPNSAIPGI